MLAEFRRKRFLILRNYQHVVADCFQCDLGRPHCGRCVRLELGCWSNQDSRYRFIVQTKPKTGRSKRLARLRGAGCSHMLMTLSDLGKDGRLIPPEEKRKNGFAARSISSETRRRHLKVPELMFQPGLVNLSPEEVLYFDRFRTKLVFQLGSHSFDEFWCRTVIRESFRDDCILDIILALGALGQALDESPAYTPMYELPVSHTSTSASLDSIKYYTRSLAKFRFRISSSGVEAASRSVLASSILFSAFELLQGNTTAANIIMEQGAAMLEGKMLHTSCLGRESQIAGRCDDEGMEDAEYILIRRLCFRSSMGHTNSYSHIARIISATAISCTTGPSPPNVRESFETFWKLWMRFLTLGVAWWHGHALRRSSAQPIGQSRSLAIQERQSLLVQVDTWLVAIEEKIGGETDTYGQQILRKIVPGLQTLQLLVRTVFDNINDLVAEMYTDAHRIFDMCEIVLEETPLFQAGLGEVYDGIQASSVAIARQCRDRELRARAVSICRRTVNSRSRWDAKEIVMATSALIDLEEGGRDVQTGIIRLARRYEWVSSSWNKTYTELSVVFEALSSKDAKHDHLEMKLRPEDYGLV